MLPRLIAAVLLVASVLLPLPALAEQDGSVGLKPWTGDLDGMKQRRVIRIAVPYSKTAYFLDRGKQFGTAVELGRALEDWINGDAKKKQVERVLVAFIPTPRDRLLPALNEGLADIAAGNLTITPERAAIADFTTPFLTNVREVLVTGPGSPEITSRDGLGGRQVFVRQSSSYREHLEALNAALAAAGKPLVKIMPADERLEDEDLLEMVNAGLLPWAVVDLHKAEIWSKVLDDIRIRDDIVIAEGGSVAWAIRKNSPALKAELDRFAETHREKTTFGNILKKRYFKDDKMLRRAYDPDRRKGFEKLLVIFDKHGGTYGFDELLLSAQGFQESELDQTRRSPRGAVGVMQLLPTTAADKAVGIPDIASNEDRNIEAGAKYLRHLIDTYIDQPGLSDLDRHLFALAAYNAGPGNLRKFRARAKDMGLNPDVWFGNVEHGAAAIVGRETVQYVSNIYKYYIAYTLLARQEAGNEAAKAATAPAASSP